MKYKYKAGTSRNKGDRMLFEARQCGSKLRERHELGVPGEASLPHSDVTAFGRTQQPHQNRRPCKEVKIALRLSCTLVFAPPPTTESISSNLDS